jgi:hypothetical protein
MTNDIDSAIEAGKFPESRRAYYEREMARDPEGTKRLIASLEPGLPPGSKLLQRKPEVRRGPIKSSAGLPLRPHPMGGYYVDASEARS